MNETIKYNRELLRKKKPFSKDNLKKRENMELAEGRKLTDRETEALINSAKREARRQRKRELLIFCISVFVTVVVILVFKVTLLKRIIDFLR